MNERIKELVKQHGVNITIDGLGYGEGNIEGLAELIVKECVHIALKDALPDWDNVASEANTQCVKIAADLKQHFGVEE